MLLLHTGGTIGMRPAAGGHLQPAAFERTLREHVPELPRLADVEFELFANLDSSDIAPPHWEALARRLHTRLSAGGIDGVVVTHGTDTMAYTASALSFLLERPPCPIVLTGAQRPLHELRSDARLNLVDAVTAALAGPREVMVSFDSRLFRGSRCTKVKVAEYDAFESPNFAPLGTMGVQVNFAPLPALRRGPFRLQAGLEPAVFLLKLFPGIEPRLVAGLLPHVKGLVIEAFGAGNFPCGEGSRSLLPVFEEARERGVAVVVTSQAHRNGIDLSLYESGAKARALGALSAGDMTTEACVVKLMHVLARARGLEDARRRFERPVCGERS